MENPVYIYLYVCVFFSLSLSITREEVQEFEVDDPPPREEVRFWKQGIWSG